MTDVKVTLTRYFKPEYTYPSKTFRYSNEFKVKVVKLSPIEGIRVQEVAITLDIHPFTLPRWRKANREGNVGLDKRKNFTEMTRK